jgi:hypothetical protein
VKDGVFVQSKLVDIQANLLGDRLHMLRVKIGLVAVPGDSSLILFIVNFEYLQPTFHGINVVFNIIRAWNLQFSLSRV